MNTPELLWKYADGECNAQEKAAVEARLANDPEFRKELEMIRELQSTLTSLDPEQPSMRFTQNVMESLPKIYAPTPVEPLVSPVWKKIFWAAVAICFTGLLVWGKNYGTAKPQPVPYVDELEQVFSAVFKALPIDILAYLTPLLFVLATLLLIDKILISKKLNPVEK